MRNRALNSWWRTTNPPVDNNKLERNPNETDEKIKLDNEKFINVLDSDNRCLGLMERITEINYEQTGIHNCRIIDETNSVVKDGHFGEFGHLAQTEYFYNFIKKHEKC